MAKASNVALPNFKQDRECILLQTAGRKYQKLDTAEQ